MNNQIFFLFYNLAHNNLFFDKLIVFFGHVFPYIVIILAGIFLLFHHEILPTNKLLNKNTIWDSFVKLKQKWVEIVLVFFSGIFAWCLAQFLKYFIHSPRPFLRFENVDPLLDKFSYAFPSGHATFYMALGFAIFFSHKKIGYLFIFFAFLIGIARIMAGVHFPIDILAGFILGALIAYLVRFSYNRILK